MSTQKAGAKKQVRRVKKNVPHGIVHIQSTFNNTIVTVTDPAGNTVAWSSAGVKGFKGSRKSTPFAAQLVAEDAARKAVEHGMKTAAMQAELLFLKHYSGTRGKNTGQSLPEIMQAEIDSKLSGKPKEKKKDSLQNISKN